MSSLQYLGSTSDFLNLGPDAVVKMPKKVWGGNPNHELRNEENVTALKVERQIIESLGNHPRIVPYLGPYKQTGIKLAKADHGNLQAYIDNNNQHLATTLRWKWVLQAAEPIAYLHSQGVIHSDLRPENYLVHSAECDLWLCDFGGSMCEKLGLDGGHLPDDPFYDPRLPWESTPATDIFSLGSILYTIMTGHWPFRTGPAPRGAEKDAFMEEANKFFAAGQFPDISNVPGGKVIKGCWDHTYSSADEVVKAIRLEMARMSM
ncbi:kinase [Pseudovirgaria hyperparasitica]|uniref:EKC/KEOPS complex subunit BUD32 n=1 Tax=Pseudovirgaria hyperparasitica TaxID=470096 RepID=A0A6A6W2I4_9PEZI|nr:kinase [Pseudovirgaria hyperparasitica]KAF2756765.1 kinase [Pseudovirgaria hyperparasitica]